MTEQQYEVLYQICDGRSIVAEPGDKITLEAGSEDEVRLLKVKAIKQVENGDAVSVKVDADIQARATALEAKNRSEIEEVAKSLAIPGISAMNKSQLALSVAQAEADSQGGEA